MAVTIDGLPLQPGVNVDRVDVAAGCRMAVSLGHTSGQALMVVEYALMRWARGEEKGAEKTWLSHFPNQTYTHWRMILAHAIASAETTGQASTDMIQ